MIKAGSWATLVPAIGTASAAPFQDKGLEANLFGSRIPKHRTLAFKSQVRPQNGSLDVLAERNSKLGSPLPYQSSSAAR